MPVRRIGHPAPGFAVRIAGIAAYSRICCSRNSGGGARCGANTAAFSVADFVLIRPLPFADPDRLVKLWEHPPGYSRMELSPADYRDWKRMSTSFEAMALCGDVSQYGRSRQS